jgi:hypothetical protein
MSNIIEALKAKFRDLYAREPARVNAAIVTGVVLVLGLVGVVVSPMVAGIIAAVVAFVAPILVAELTRPKVVPTAQAEERVQMTAEVAYAEGQHDGRIMAAASAPAPRNTALGGEGSVPGDG